MYLSVALKICILMKNIHVFHPKGKNTKAFFHFLHSCKKFEIASPPFAMTDIVMASNIVAKQFNF
jgi:hypothetical protein